MAKTYKDIQAESDRLFGKGASREKFQWRQAQQRAEGLDVEKRQRGGVAEVWDRNKKVISPVAQLVAGALGGPGAAAALGAAMKGLDRPGKGGIGLDLGQAALGGIQGYGMGQLGAAAGARLGMGQAAQAMRAMPTPGAGTTAIGSRTAGMVAPPGMAGAAAPLPPMPTPGAAISSVGQRAAGAVMPQIAQGITPQAVSIADRLAAGAGKVGEMAKGAGAYLAKKPEVAGMAINAVAQSRNAAAQREIQREQMAQGQQQFEKEFGLRQSADQREVERQRRIAEMLAPLFQRIAGGQR